MTSEKLYLGDRLYPSMTRHRKVAEPYYLNPVDLVTHMFVCGASGAGKTVMGKSVVEEAALAGIPSIVVDLKGDLSCLAIPGAALGNPGEACDLARTILGDEFKVQRDGFAKACAGSKQVRERAHRFASGVCVDVFTPKSNALRPLQMSSFPKPGKRPEDCEPQEREDYQELLQAFVKSFLARVRGKLSAGKNAHSEEGLLYALLEHSWQNDISLEGLEGVTKLVNWVFDPPLARVGALPVELAIKDKHREQLAREINSQLTGVEPQWYLGESFDIERLVRPRDGQTPIVILNLSHLHEFYDQAFVVAQVCHSIYRWMRGLGGTSSPRLLFFLDEVGGAGGGKGFYPSYPYNPPCKGALNVVLRQGRAFGVSVLLATQNVIGVDHSGLGNIGTWAVSDLTSPRERDRIQETIGEKGFATRVANLREHEFLLRSKTGEIDMVQERWLYSAHHVVNPHSLSKIGEFLDAWRKERPTGTEPRPADHALATEDEGLADERREFVPQPAEPSYSSRLPGPDATDFTFEPTVEDEDSVDATITQTTSDWILEIEGKRAGPAMGIGTYTLGRHDACDVVVSDPAVSRRHVVFDVTREGIRVSADAASKNRVDVDDETIPPGESIQVQGDSANLRVGGVQLILRRKS
jgi:Inner membrane component of T3SS, cytoplasmic domain/Helicase HerA-like C-terminal